MTNKVWLIGTNYTLTDKHDVKLICDLIDSCKSRSASGDLSSIAYELLSLAVAGAKQAEFSVARENAEEVIIGGGPSVL